MTLLLPGMFCHVKFSIRHIHSHVSNVTKYLSNIVPISHTFLKLFCAAGDLNGPDEIDDNSAAEALKDKIRDGIGGLTEKR